LSRYRLQPFSLCLIKKMFGRKPMAMLHCRIGLRRISRRRTPDRDAIAASKLAQMRGFEASTRIAVASAKA